ncbi:MAG: cyclic nucleotide-binding domain-containing protein, partial [Desulfatiglandales bacterium]
MGTQIAGEVWAELRASGLVHQIDSGEVLFREGDETEGAFVLLSGRCAVSERGERVNMIEPGELFGE